MYVNCNNMAYFDSFGVEHVQKEFKKFIGGILSNKLSSVKNSYTINPNTAEQTTVTLSLLENHSTPFLSAPKESRIAYKDNDGFKIEKTEHLNAGISTLKVYILEHYYLIKNSVKDIRSETVAPEIWSLLKPQK